MPSQAAQLASAKAAVQLYAQTTIAPTVADSSTELQAILAECLRASIWVQNTAYTVGAVVVPTTRNGHRYICVQGGTSETLLADEPEWSVVRGSFITDGDSNPQLVWREDGPDYENLYDIRRAIHLTWLLKAAKVAHLYETRQSGSTFAHDQVYKHCMEMAAKYAPVRIA